MTVGRAYAGDSILRPVLGRDISCCPFAEKFPFDLADDGRESESCPVDDCGQGSILMV